MSMIPKKDPAGQLLADFHMVTRNSIGYKKQLTQHLVHYSEHVAELMTEARQGHDGTGIQLQPDSFETSEFFDVLKARQSSRDFSGEGIGFGELSTLLHYSTGCREQTGYSRFTPSSGGLLSVELYPMLFRVEGLAGGLYRYDPTHNVVSLLTAGDFRVWTRENVFFQREFSSASAAIVIAANIGRLTGKYGLRGYRLALLDAGHVSQQLYLIATRLGLKVCATAGFIDDELNDALGLDGHGKSVLLVVLIGK